MSKDAVAVTALIQSSANGDHAALSELLDTIYEELQRIARARRHGERPDSDLHTTALVHEAVLKLADHDLGAVRDTKHLLTLASRIMRHLLVDHARKRQSAKRMGERQTPEQRPSFIIDKGFNVELLDLDRAIRELGQSYPRLERVVECRFFGGLTNDEVGDVLELSPRTVKRDWLRAKSYLLEILRS